MDLVRLHPPPVPSVQVEGALRPGLEDLQATLEGAGVDEQVDVVHRPHPLVRVDPAGEVDPLEGDDRDPLGAQRFDHLAVLEDHVHVLGLDPDVGPLERLEERLGDEVAVRSPGQGPVEEGGHPVFHGEPDHERPLEPGGEESTDLPVVVPGELGPHAEKDEALFGCDHAVMLAWERLTMRNPGNLERRNVCFRVGCAESVNFESDFSEGLLERSGYRPDVLPASTGAHVLELETTRTRLWMLRAKRSNLPSFSATWLRVHRGLLRRCPPRNVPRVGPLQRCCSVLWRTAASGCGNTALSRGLITAVPRREESHRIRFSLFLSPPGFLGSS